MLDKEENSASLTWLSASLWHIFVQCIHHILNPPQLLLNLHMLLTRGFCLWTHTHFLPACLICMMIAAFIFSNGEFFLQCLQCTATCGLPRASSWSSRFLLAKVTSVSSLSYSFQLLSSSCKKQTKFTMRATDHQKPRKRFVKNGLIQNSTCFSSTMSTILGCFYLQAQTAGWCG